MRPAWRSSQRAVRGFTLVDLLVVIVLLGIVAGTLTGLMSRLAAQSAQAMREREAIALVHGLLDEVMLMPMTLCDPQDPTAATAVRAVVGAGGCAARVELQGPEPGESRYGASRFDNVNDYHGLQMPGPGCAGLCDASGNRIDSANSSWTGCSAAVVVGPVALPGVAALDADGQPQALRVLATLRCPGRPDAVAEGVRLRHAPRTF